MLQACQPAEPAAGALQPSHELSGPPDSEQASASAAQLDSQPTPTAPAAAALVQCLSGQERLALVSARTRQPKPRGEDDTDEEDRLPNWLRSTRAASPAEPPATRQRTGSSALQVQAFSAEDCAVLARGARPTRPWHTLAHSTPAHSLQPPQPQSQLQASGRASTGEQRSMLQCLDWHAFDCCLQGCCADAGPATPVWPSERNSRPSSGNLGRSPHPTLPLPPRLLQHSLQASCQLQLMAASPPLACRAQSTHA